MAPRYEIDVPGERSAEFLAAVSQFGGKVIKEGFSRDEVAAEWKRQTNIAISLIDAFAEKHDKVITDKIEDGLISFIKRCYRPIFKEWEQIDELAVVKKRLFSAFADSLPDNMPEDVWATSKIIDGETRIVLNRGRLSFGLSPHDIIILIEEFGLADGVPKSADYIRNIHKITVTKTRYKGNKKLEYHLLGDIRPRFR